MKEKTFEELIEENTNWNKDIFGGYEKTISPKKVLKLMQQVREATIEEIENKANEYGEYGTADYAHELPTDRIKTDL